MKLHVQTLFVAIGLGIKRNWGIFVAIILGLFAGNFIHEHPNFPAWSMEMIDFIGNAFIRLIQMIVIPLVCSAIIVGISSIGESKQLGKFGKKMLFYYALITIAAVAIGAGLVIAFQPGIGIQEYISKATAADIQQQFATMIETQRGQMSEFFLSAIPQNPLESLAKGEMVPIVCFALIFALALAKVGEINRPIVVFFESVFDATMKVTDWVMFFAIPGIFSLTTVAVAHYGLSAFASISKFILVVFLGFTIQLVIVYPLMLKIFSKVPVGNFYAAMIEALLVAFGTASSSATLPLTMACCEKRGISHKVCSFVLPLGATLNLDGTALFQTIGVIFLTQAYGVTLEPIQILFIMLLAIVASSTSAGIPGAGLITIALILNGIGLTPAQLSEGLAFMFAMDRIIDMFRTAVNVASDAVVAAIIADNENELDYSLFSNTEEYKDII